MLLFYFFSFIIFPIIIIGSLRKVKMESSCLIGKQEVGVIRGISAVFIMESHFLAYAQNMGEWVSKPVYTIIGQLGGVGVLLFSSFLGMGYTFPMQIRHLTGDLYGEE